MNRSAFVALVLVAACGGSSGGGGDDDMMQIDAPLNGKTFHISGTATTQAPGADPAPTAGVLVEAYANADENTVVAMATTAADGTYTLTVTVAGDSLDGYLKATKSGNVDTYLYPPAPLTADFDAASINELSTTNFGLLRSVGGAAGEPLIVLEVVDSTMATIAGAMVTSTPAAAHVGYTAAGLIPVSITATETMADGRAFLFGDPVGSVTINATATGHTFKPTTVKARADVFTTTLVTE